MSETWTVKRLLEWTTDYLAKNGRSSPRLEAEILLAKSLACQRIELYTNFETEPTEPQRTAFREYVKRRAAGEPVAYLVGHKEFYSLAFQVDRSTLIPRPETEQLVVEAFDELKTRQAPDPLICDVGTGSGAIAIALVVNMKKQKIPGRMIAVDLSGPALKIARKNGETHKVSDRIEWVESDLLEKITEPIDILVSNPPYVSASEYENLDAEVKNYEPQSALLAGEKGTEIIARLISQAADHLAPRGRILIELSPMIAGQTVPLFDTGIWNEIRLLKDFAGLNRIASAVKR